MHQAMKQRQEVLKLYPFLIVHMLLVYKLPLCVWNIGLIDCYERSRKLHWLINYTLAINQSPSEWQAMQAATIMVRATHLYVLILIQVSIRTLGR